MDLYLVFYGNDDSSTDSTVLLLPLFQIDFPSNSGVLATPGGLNLVELLKPRRRCLGSFWVGAVVVQLAGPR